MSRTWRMSCSLTAPQVRAGVKTVTRRHAATWGRLQPGDRLVLVEKAMGLPKGARQVVLREAVVVDVRLEPLHLVADDDYGWFEVYAEGFGPGADEADQLSPDEFVSFWLDAHRVLAFESQAEL